MSEPFHGVLPALITPFTDDGEAIDTDALAAHVDRLIAAGTGLAAAEHVDARIREVAHV
jgi:dihydrodipicolinate synthase/N-acetylneuraminate lyase